MAKKIYLTGIEKTAGKSFIAVGLLAALQSLSLNLRVFQLFSESDKDETALLKKLSKHDVKPLMPLQKAMTLLESHPDDLFRSIFDEIEPHSDKDLLWFDGTHFDSDSHVFEFEFNLKIGGQLDCDIFLMMNAKDRSPPEIISIIKSALSLAKKNYARVTAIIINRVEPALESTLQKELASVFKEKPVIILIPEVPKLSHPSMAEITKKLKAQIICGENELHRQATQITVAAKTLEGFLASRHQRENMVIVTPGDRIDILLGSLLADQSVSYPKIAGIVLTGNDMPPPPILDIISGLEHPFPVILTKTRTYETATALYSAKYSLSADNMQKVEDAIHAMSPILLPPLSQLVKEIAPPSLNPTLFLNHLVNRVKISKQHIVLPEGDDLRILEAAHYLLSRHLVDITLLGSPEKIRLLAKRNNLSLPNVKIINPETSKLKTQFAKTYFKLRQHKNVNLPIALERMTDPNYFATMMVYEKLAKGVVSGARHTTADTVRPALEIIKTKPGISKVSSIFVMCLSSRVLIYGDCAINPEPDSEMLRETAEEASKIAENFGMIPKVAFLSYSSGKSGKGQSVEKIEKAFQLFKERNPSIACEGPIQYDAAVDPQVSEKKMPNSPIKGEANVLIFPDLNTGNNTYKAVQRETGALAIGPILLGLNFPINDLSRGAKTEDIINTILITAIQAEGK